MTLAGIPLSLVESDATWHVYPVNDDVAHIFSGMRCWCQPTVEMVRRQKIVTHYKFDEPRSAPIDAARMQ